jgi:cytochrome c556
MNRLFVCAGALALGVFVVSASVEAGGDKKKPPSISTIMKATHGKTGFRAKFQGAAKEKSWDKAEKIAKDWLACCENLLKNTPPKGEKESWEKHANGYIKAVKTIVEASGKMEDKRVNGSLGYIAKSCGGCHKEHQKK